MSAFIQSLTQEHSAYRRLLLLTAVVTYLHILFGGVLLLHMVAGVLIGISGALAWYQTSLPAAVRRPAMLAVGLLALHLLLTFIAITGGLPALIVISSHATAALIVGCLLVAYSGLVIPDERSEQRVAGQAVQGWRRDVRLVGAAAVASWLLLLAGTLTRVTGLDAALVQTLHTGLLGGVGLLTLVLLWRVWRTRRHDRATLHAAELAAGFAATQAAVGATATFFALPPMPDGARLLLSLALWSSLVVLGVLLLRRPIPATNTRPAATAQTGIKQPGVLRDYISLTKPKVISLLLVTTLAAMFITDAGMPSLALVLWTMLGGYLAAGGAGAINCAFEKELDNNMGRTSRRPVPSGRIRPRNALLFGLTLSVLSVVVLWTFTTPLAALLSTIGIFYYALFYTRWLKPNTWHNIIIGGGAGSLPPLVGWAAVTGSLNLSAVVLFLIIFYWTPPHFWALALVKEKDYARAGVPMLPVIAGIEETRWQILLYSLLMFALTLLLVPLQAMGLLYLVLALLLGGLFLRSAWQVWRIGGQPQVWGLYKYSLLYLALLYAAMVLDRVLLG